MSRRDQIRMTDAEIDAFLREGKTLNVATKGPGERIHLVAMWYGFFADGALGFWTYGKSQKIVNLERNPQLTGLVEAGERYEELRGVMLRTEVTLHHDPQVVEGIAMGLVDKYSGPGPEFDPVRDFFRGQVPKRVGLEFVERRRVTWDHRKLAGVY